MSDYPQKRPVGRPTKYDPEWMIPMLLTGFQEGMSKLEAAHSIGINIDTMYAWCEIHPEFSEAVKTGVQMSEVWWQWMGRSNLKSEVFRDALWYMNMKNRFGWRDKQEVTGDPKAPVAIQVVEPVGLEELTAAFVKAGGTD